MLGLSHWLTFRTTITSLTSAARSFLRSCPLFFAARPRTPLRVLCIMAFDTLHRARYATPLPAHKQKLLAALLDFGACANAALDNKIWNGREYRQTLQILEDAGMRTTVADYLNRLSYLESTRPSPGDNEGHFLQIARYRENVVRLSLAILAIVAWNYSSLDDGISAVSTDADLRYLFYIVMQCQIIDDVLDYSSDKAAGLPSFLTAATSLNQSRIFTSQAAHTYALAHDLSQAGHLMPWRLVLFLASSIVRLVLCQRTQSFQLAISRVLCHTTFPA